MLLPPPGHDGLVTAHTEDPLRCPGIAKILDLPFAVSATEARGAESLLSCEDSQFFDFVTAGAAAVGAVVADEGAIAEEEKVGIGVEKGVACIAAETIQMPSVAGWGKGCKLA